MDVSESLRAAAEDADRWSPADVRRFCEVISHAVGGRCDWDEDAGEDWARVIRADRVAAIVSRVLPFAILTDGVPGPGAPDRSAPMVISVSSMDEPLLSCDQETLDKVFGARLPGPPVFDPQAFSVDDLWFATV